MKIKSEYFPHDYNSMSDDGIEILVNEYKAIGYGVYWYLIELLHKETSNKFKIDSKKLFYLIKKNMNVEEDDFTNMLKFMIDICELFKSNKIEFWSDRVIVNIKRRKDISEKNSKNGKKSHIKKEEVWDEN